MLVLVWPCSFVGRATLIQSESREFNSFRLCQSFSLFFGRPNGMTSAKAKMDIAKYSTSLYPLTRYFICQEPDFLPSQYYENQYFIMRLDGGGCRQNHSLGYYVPSGGKSHVFNVTSAEEHKKPVKVENTNLCGFQRNWILTHPSPKILFVICFLASSRSFHFARSIPNFGGWSIVDVTHAQNEKTD